MTINLPVVHFDPDMGLEYILDGGPGNWAIQVGNRFPVPLSDENAQAFIEHANGITRGGEDAEGNSN